MFATWPATNPSTWRAHAQRSARAIGLVCRARALPATASTARLPCSTVYHEREVVLERRPGEDEVEVLGVDVGGLRDALLDRAHVPARVDRDYDGVALEVFNVDLERADIGQKGGRTRRHRARTRKVIGRDEGGRGLLQLHSQAKAWESDLPNRSDRGVVGLAHEQRGWVES